MRLEVFLNSIGEEVLDADEESFLLFSRPIPSANLGFVDSRSATVDVTLHGLDFLIHQSPSLLSSTRAGGTTGAVLWKITPRFAQWMSSRTQNPFWRDPETRTSTKEKSLLNCTSTIVELGCGISGLLALALGPSVQRYIATDQEYVHRLLRTNIEENAATALQLEKAAAADAGNSKTKSLSNTNRTAKKDRKNKHSGRDGGDDGHQYSTSKKLNITFTPLDWEVDDPKTLKSASTGEHHHSRRTALNAEDDADADHGNGNSDSDSDPGFDFLLSCDCIYNEALIPPFVRTCVELGRLRPTIPSRTAETADNDADADADADESKEGKEGQQLYPTICLVAQQQRSPDVFEAWLRESLRFFRVWRLGDEVLSDGSAGGDADAAAAGLGSGSGFVVHCLLLKE